MSEADLERKLSKGAMSRAGLALKWVSTNYTGVPDRIVFLPWRRFYLVELKFGKVGRISPRQALVGKLLGAIGFKVWYIRDDVELTEFWRIVDGES